MRVRRRGRRTNVKPSPELLRGAELTVDAFVEDLDAEEVAITHTHHETRHIYMNRSHPGKDELWPTRMGHSIGHWDGNTLIVDTVAVRGDLWLIERYPTGETRWTIMSLSDPCTAGGAGVPLLAGRGLVQGAPAAYVCRDFTCHAPVVDPADLVVALSGTL